jgi:hypothetical protein
MDGSGATVSAKLPRNVKLTRRPAEDVPEWVTSSWYVEVRDTGRLLGYVEAEAEIDYRRKGSRFGTQGKGYVAGSRWVARTPDGSKVSDEDDTRGGAVSELLRHHGIDGVYG